MSDADADGAPGAAGRRSRALPEQELIRHGKLEALRSRGIDPYASGFTPSSRIGDLVSEFSGIEPGARTGRQVAVAGRVIRNRVTGKLIFAELRDWSGQMQVMIEAGVAGADRVADWKESVDLGDLVGVVGEIIGSRRGELSVLVDHFEITAKCLVPLPDKYRGLSDPEARVRQRYLDMIVNERARDVVRLRAALTRSIRDSLWREGFVEVETPMLQVVHGGANARPFRTHINAYDLELYLRIAPELYLKRLLVGGAERVFELNRNFRNEGADSSHNPEFTSLEMYAAYSDYDEMRILTREMIIDAATAVHGSPVVFRPGPSGDQSASVDGGGGSLVDISGDWPVVAVHDAVSAALDCPIGPGTSQSELLAAANRRGVTPPTDSEAGATVLWLYEELVERATTFPTFYRDFPVETSPLTRRKPSDARLAERWDLVAWGSEIATAYSELTDPIDQRERLYRQSLLAARGDEEAMQVDEDFIRALEFGMPPAGGQGMGVDRLLMLLTGRSIRDAILFPLVRPGH